MADAEEPRDDGAPAKLIDAAVAMIASHGWRAATTRAIAERAGVNLALVNYHFGSKRGLLLAAFEAAIDQMMTAFPVADFVANPAAMIKASVDMLERTPEDPRLRVLFEAIVEAPSDPEVARAAAAVLTGYREQLARALAGGRRPAARHRGRAAAIVALLDGLFLHRLVDPTFRPRIAVESIERLLHVD